MSIDLRVGELERLVRWLSSRTERALEAVFRDTAVNASSSLRVTVAGYDDGEHTFGPVVWSPLGGALPAAGDRALVAESDDGSWWVLAWWSAAQSAQDAVGSYTPAWTSTGTQPSVGNGTLTGRYQRVGGLVFFVINLTPGGSTTFGTGFYNFSLPVPALASVRQIMGGLLTDVTVQSYDVDAAINGGSVFEEIVVGSNTFGPGNWSSLSPFTFGVSDRIAINGVYIAA